MYRNELQPIEEKWFKEKQKLEKHYHAGLKALACGALVCDDYNKVCISLHMRACGCEEIITHDGSE
jgi:hypothetical protein